MTTLYGSLRLRPTRIGFLVPTMDHGAICEVMQVCNCLWGGRYNPIIPVADVLPDAWKDHITPDTSGLDVARGYVEFFEPDVFVESTPGLAEKLGVEASAVDFGRPKIIPLQAFHEKGSDRHSRIPFGLNIFDVYKSLYDKEFRFVPRHDRPVALVEKVGVDDAFVDAAYGSFPAAGVLARSVNPISMPSIQSGFPPMPQLG